MSQVIQLELFQRTKEEILEARLDKLESQYGNLRRGTFQRFTDSYKEHEDIRKRVSALESRSPGAIA